jgi:alkylated DNA repair dioxygenase AlkB
MWTQNNNLLPLEGEVYLHEHFFTATESEELFGELLETVEWKQDHMTIFGKHVNLPRLTAWYANEGKSYQYSGIRNKPLPWIPVLLDIKQYVEDKLDTCFNSALLNLYRNHKDSIGWHCDNEPELGADPVIASLSFGCNRTFQLKHKKFPDKKISVPLQKGSLLLMQGSTQANWLHRLSTSAEYDQPRINITFRTIK